VPGQAGVRRQYFRAYGMSVIASGPSAIALRTSLRGATAREPGSIKQPAEWFRLRLLIDGWQRVHVLYPGEC